MAELAFPHSSVAMTDAAGRMTREGLRFWLGMWDRTGQSSGTLARLTISDTVLLHSTVALTNGAGSGAGTLTNAPAAGNPTKWLAIDDNGTTRYIPAW